jgi:hypothetical protein
VGQLLKLIDNPKSWARLLGSFRENTRLILSNGQLIIGGIGTVFLLAWEVLHPIEQKPTMALAFVQLVALVYLVSGGIRLVTKRTGGFDDVIHIAGRTLFAVFLFMFSPAIAALVEALAEATLANPSEMIAFGLAGVFTYSILQLGARLQGISFHRPADRPPIQCPPQRIARLRQAVAKHEAGHVLLFAALRTFPQDLQVEIYPGGQSGDAPTLLYQGRVSYSVDPAMLHSKAMQAWQMSVRPAGLLTEEAFSDDLVTNARFDLQNWIEQAHAYLSNGYGEAYFSDPIDAAQSLHNQIVLERLRLQQIEQLREWIFLNRPLLGELSEQIEKHEVLKIAELQRFFRRVAWTESIRPVPDYS